MRTTLTLDDDVAAGIDELRRVDRASLREVVNRALRVGLARLSESPTDRTPVRTRSVSLGGCLLPDVDDVAEVLAITEGEARR